MSAASVLSGTVAPVRLRHCGGVLVVLAGSTAVFWNRRSLAHQMNFRIKKKGTKMNLELRQSNSFLTHLLLLAAVFVPVQPSSAAPQSQQNADTTFSKLRSQAEQGDAVAQYNLAQSYLRHDPTNEDYQSALKWLHASVAQGNASAEAKQHHNGELWKSG